MYERVPAYLSLNAPDIERRLFEKIGETAYMLHTGRSRNEQIVLDERLYLMDASETLEKKLKELSLCAIDVVQEQESAGSDGREQSERMK